MLVCKTREQHLDILRARQGCIRECGRRLSQRIQHEKSCGCRAHNVFTSTFSSKNRTEAGSFRDTGNRNLERLRCCRTATPTEIFWSFTVAYHHLSYHSLIRSTSPILCHNITMAFSEDTKVRIHPSSFPRASLNRRTETDDAKLSQFPQSHLENALTDKPGISPCPIPLSNRSESSRQSTSPRLCCTTAGKSIIARIKSDRDHTLTALQITNHVTSPNVISQGSFRPLHRIHPQHAAAKLDQVSSLSSLFPHTRHICDND